MHAYQCKRDRIKNGDNVYLSGALFEKPDANGNHSLALCYDYVKAIVRTSFCSFKNGKPTKMFIVERPPLPPLPNQNSIYFNGIPCYFNQEKLMMKRAEKNAREGWFKETFEEEDKKWREKWIKFRHKESKERDQERRILSRSQNLRVKKKAKDMIEKGEYEWLKPSTWFFAYVTPTSKMLSLRIDPRFIDDLYDCESRDNYTLMTLNDKGKWQPYECYPAAHDLAKAIIAQYPINAQLCAWLKRFIVRPTYRPSIKLSSN